MMDGDQDNTLQVEEHDGGSCQDVSPAVVNGVSAEITKEISPSQHERWRDLVFDIQLRAQEDDFLRANGGSFTPTLSPVSKRFTFSPMASPRVGRRGGSMSPPSSSRRMTTLKNVFNFKNRNNNNADIEEGDGRDNKSNIPRTWSLTNLLTPRKSKKTESLPVTPLNRSNPESTHESYAVDHVTSMVSMPIRRTRSVPTLIDKYGNVKSACVLRMIPTPSRGDTERLEMMHGHEDVPEEEAVCRICMVELGEDSEAFKMECMCKGELALAHRECTIKWFTIKGNVTCDVCKQDVTNLPVTLLRVEDDDPHEDRSREAEHNTEVNDEWQDVPILVSVSMLAYFCFLEQLLVMDMKSSAVAVALPFACIIGLLGSVTSTTMVEKRKFVWLFATIQYSFVVLFGHVFYSRNDVKQPVTCIVLATMVGFGLTMSGTAVINVFLEWRRSHAHHHQPANTDQVVTPPVQAAENR